MHTTTRPIESTLPAPWELERGFHDTLYDWMERAPWLAISAAAHLLVFFVLASIPWDQFQPKKVRPILATIETIEPEPFDEVIEVPPEVSEPTDIEEPVLADEDDVPIDDPDPVTASADIPSTSDLFDPTDDIATPIGLGPGGKLGDRFGPASGRGRSGGEGTERALRDGLVWLAEHQSPDGSWDADGFGAQCGDIGSTICDGAGNPAHDVGLTGLALLAFLGNGNTTSRGAHRDVVLRGMRWLRTQQDPDTGLFGEASSHDFVYDHAIATLAMCELYYFSRSPLLGRSAQGAIDYVQRARNPYGAWRYDVPPLGDSDTSVTGWMVLALASAKDAGLRVDEEAFEGALLWLDEVTDTATGRVGYSALGELSSRTRANEHYPPEAGEAMTAVGLLCRFFLGQDPEETEVMERHADLLARRPPAWDDGGLGNDMYYWYYGSYAMYQMGGDRWRRWNAAMKSAVLDSQRTDGDEKGSWDPIGPWGYAGGRVYSTALMVLSLEVYFRYAKLIGAR